MQLTVEVKAKICGQVYDFFARECEVDQATISDETNIIEELNGDSLMFLELITQWKNEFNLNIELRVIGKYMTKNPADTIGKVINLAYLMLEKGDGFAEEAENALA